MFVNGFIYELLEDYANGNGLQLFIQNQPQTYVIDPIDNVRGVNIGMTATLGTVKFEDGYKLYWNVRNTFDQDVPVGFTVQQWFAPQWVTNQTVPYPWNIVYNNTLTNQTYPWGVNQTAPIISNVTDPKTKITTVTYAKPLPFNAS
jgi:hypothetical protein